MVNPLSSLGRHRTARLTIRVLFSLAMIYIAALAILLAIEDRLVYHPRSATERWQPAPAGRAVADVTLQTDAGTQIHARWFPCPRATGAVLICHSRGGNLSTEISEAELDGWHRQLKTSVLIFDYPGYGRSAGRPSELGCYEAARAAHRWLTETKGIASDGLLIYGRSLGSAVAVDLASRTPHRALILVSPFPSLPAVAGCLVPILPAHLLMRNRFPSDEKIHRCVSPVFILHGTADRQVPFVLGKQLFEQANEPKRFMAVEGGQHGNCVQAEFISSLRLFLQDQESQKQVSQTLSGPHLAIRPCKGRSNSLRGYGTAFQDRGWIDHTFPGLWPGLTEPALQAGKPRNSSARVLAKARRTQRRRKRRHHTDMPACVT